VTEANPAQACGIEHRRDRVARTGEHLLESGVHQEGLIIGHQELVELNAVVGRVRRNPIHIVAHLGH
jgi:hypothetical protein